MLANGSVTAGNVGAWYHALRQPPGAPPDWLFAPVWTVLYGLIGVSAWLVWCRVEVGAHRKRAALRRWGWQLMANALWPPAFFGVHAPGLALAVLLLLLGTIVFTMLAFWPIRRLATWLLVPYLAWTCLALYLNAGIVLLNRG